jgi:hypothetical protein
MTDDKGCSLGGISFKTTVKTLKKDESDMSHDVRNNTGVGPCEGEIKMTNLTCFTALLDVQVNHPNIDFLKSQMGKYALGKEYNICFECWLKSMGVKP